MTLNKSVDLSSPGQAQSCSWARDGAECRASTPTHAPGDHPPTLPPGARGMAGEVEKLAVFSASGSSGTAARALPAGGRGFSAVGHWPIFVGFQT